MSRFSVLCAAAVAAALVAGPAGAAPPKGKAPVKRPAAAAPAPACYSPPEFEAEQALRLHTELMVIGLKCQEAYKDKNPFGAYNQFTQTQKTALAAWEKRLIGYFGRAGGGGSGSATARFDSFRTGLANEASRRVATIGATEYCEAMVPLAVQAATLSPAEVTKLVGDEHLMRLSRHPVCGTTGKGAGAGAAPAAKAQPAVATMPRAQKPAKARKKPKGS